MSFLAPLFMAGLAAVSLPILFHMIRRTPRGHFPFSTLMFLKPSPPRITRRSRLDNWPLLLLRILALCLIAMAFARPFLRETLGIGVDYGAGSRVAVLLDTSASMRRGNLWKQAREQAMAVIDETTVDDELALFTFDRKLKPLVTFEEWSTLEPASRKQLARERLQEITPGWAATDLGGGLVAAADSLDALSSNDTDKQTSVPKEIILISDLQAGSDLDRLQGFQWPKDVRLRTKRVTVADTTNAGLQLVADTGKAPSSDAKKTIRVSVTNAGDSANEQFRIRWKGQTGQTDKDDTIDVYVPPGRTRIVSVPVPENAPAGMQLELLGDAHSFDNVVYIDTPRMETVTVLYYGNDAEDDPQQPRFFVERAFPQTGYRTVRLIPQDQSAPLLLPVADDVRLVVVTEELTEPHSKSLSRYVKQGGTVLWMARIGDDCRSLGELLGRDFLEVTEAEVDGYAMLTGIDFSHPVFAPFDDVRFADFTKIYVWKHRRLAADAFPEARVLASFDDGDPAILEIPLEAGRVLLFTTGWHPQDSQLALSTKFVPLLNSILEISAGRVDDSPRFSVGDPLPMRRAPSTNSAARNIRLPDNSEIQLAAGEESFTGTVVPGLYTILTPSDESQFAVNVPAQESKTAPLSVEKLETLGVRLAGSDSGMTAAEVRERERQMQAKELENRQKFWRWLIVAAIAVLILETWLAGRFARRHDTAI